MMAGIYFIFLKGCPRPNSKVFPKPDLEIKDKIEKVVIM